MRKCLFWDANENVLQCLTLRQDWTGYGSSTQTSAWTYHSHQSLWNPMWKVTLDSCRVCWQGTNAMAGLSPERPQGTGAVAEAHRPSATSGLKASCCRSVWEGAVQSAKGIFWNCCYGLAQGVSASSRISKRNFSAWLPRHCESFFSFVCGWRGSTFCSWTSLTIKLWGDDREWVLQSSQWLGCHCHHIKRRHLHIQLPKAVALVRYLKWGYEVIKSLYIWQLWKTWMDFCNNTKLSLTLDFRTERKYSEVLSQRLYFSDWPTFENLKKKKSKLYKIFNSRMVNIWYNISFGCTM